MKRLLTVMLAAAMSFGMMISALASELVYIDTSAADSETGLFVPGVTYYLPAYDGNFRMEDDFFQFYKTTITVTQGKKYVSTARFEKGSDGYIYLVFRSNMSADHDNTETVELTIKSVDKKDKDNKYETVLTLDVGFNGSDYVSSSEFEFDPFRPIVEFDEDLSSCKIIFDNGTSYGISRFASKRTFNFGYSTEALESLEQANPNARMEFMSFYSGLIFPSTGVLKFYAPDMKYLYEFDSSGNLKLLSSENNNDYFGVSTDTLTSYVASDVQLKNANGSSASSAPSSSAPSSSAPSTPPQGSSSQVSPSAPAPSTTPSGGTGGGSDNPPTGAAA